MTGLSTSPSAWLRAGAAFEPLALLLVALIAVAACDGNQVTPDAQVPDSGPHDGVIPGDVPSQNDSGWTGQENVGAPCDPEDGAGCEGGAICLNVRGPLSDVVCDLASGDHEGCGVCVLAGCSLEDIETSEIEDNCPVQSMTGGGTFKTVCTRVPVAASADGGAETINFCLPSCTPSAELNPCRDLLDHPGLSCDPVSIVLNDVSEVCLFPSCVKDADCGNKNPLTPDSTCHLPTGLCHTKGSTDGHIGGACKVSADCGQYQYCFPEQVVDGAVVAEGGYCTLFGCQYYEETKATFWQCPAESSCFVIQGLSLCLATGCSPEEPPAQDGCRDEAAEGQYDCFKPGNDQPAVCWLDFMKR